MSNSTIDNIVKKLKALQAELEIEINQLISEKQQQFQYTLNNGKIEFDKTIKKIQLQYKIGSIRYIFSSKIKHLLTIPIIYSVIIPLVLLDLFVTLYQQICFRVYNIPIVSRSKYIIIDRQMLAYLNIFQKINCIYCGYGNGLIEYAREVSARTEQYWCPIKHARRSPDPHYLVDSFTDYGDGENYNVKLKKLRDEIANITSNE